MKLCKQCSERVANMKHFYNAGYCDDCLSAVHLSPAEAMGLIKAYGDCESEITKRPNDVSQAMWDRLRAAAWGLYHSLCPEGTEAEFEDLVKGIVP